MSGTYCRAFLRLPTCTHRISLPHTHTHEETDCSRAQLLTGVIHPVTLQKVNLTNCASSVSCAAFGSDLPFHFFSLSLYPQSVRKNASFLQRILRQQRLDMTHAALRPPIRRSTTPPPLNEAAGRTRPRLLRPLLRTCVSRSCQSISVVAALPC